MRLREQVVAEQLAAGQMEEQVRAVIERGRQIRRAPDVVRARLLARARVVVARSAAATRLALPEAAPAWRGRRLAFAAAALLLLFSAAGATAALYVHATRSVERSAEIVPIAHRSPETVAKVASARGLGTAETSAPQPLSRPKLQRSTGSRSRPCS